MIEWILFLTSLFLPGAMPQGVISAGTSGGGGGGSITFQQATTAVDDVGCGDTNNCVITFTSPNQNPSQLLGGIVWQTTTNNLDTPTDSLTNTWNLIAGSKVCDTTGDGSTATSCVELAWASNTHTGTDTVHFSFNSQGNFSPHVQMCIAEITGGKTSTPIDQSAAATALSGQPSPGAITTTASGDFIFALNGNQSGVPQTWTPASGFTLIGSGNTYFCQQQIQSAAGSVTASASGTNTAHPWVAGVTSYEHN